MSLYSMWVALTQRKQLFWAVAAGIALFVAGWHTGRVMSPYYASHPIVFQESDGSPQAAISDMPQQVAALQEESRELRAAASSPATTAVAAPSGAPAAIAGTSTGQQSFVASVNSNLYHHVSCPAVAQIKEENKVWFSSAEEAEKAGYSPSKCMQEKLER